MAVQIIDHVDENVKSGTVRLVVLHQDRETGSHCVTEIVEISVTPESRDKRVDLATECLLENYVNIARIDRCYAVGEAAGVLLAMQPEPERIIRIKVQHSRLSDDSLAYNVLFGNVNMPALTQDDAALLAWDMKTLIERHTNESVFVVDDE